MRHSAHVPSAAVVFVDESGETDAWAAQVQAVTQAGFCAVLLARAPLASERQGSLAEAQICAEDLADLLRRLDHDSTTVVGRDHAVAGVVRLLADDLDAKVDQAVLVGLVLPAVPSDRSVGSDRSDDSDGSGGSGGTDAAETDSLIAQLRRIHIPVFVARSTDEPQSVDEFAADLHAWLPDRWTVRSYREPTHLLTRREHGAFMDDLLDFLGGSPSVRLPRIDLSAPPTSAERDS